MRQRHSVSFLWFLQNKAHKKVVKYMTAWQELHALPTKTFYKFYFFFTYIFCSKTCFSSSSLIIFIINYTLNIPVTCSHNIVMAHTHLHKFLSICGWTWKLVNRGSFCSAQFMCNIESHSKKKKFSFIRDGYVQVPSLKDKNCLQKYFYESKVYSWFHHPY